MRVLFFGNWLFAIYNMISTALFVYNGYYQIH